MIPLEIINEDEYRKKDLSVLIELRDELSKLLDDKMIVDRSISNRSLRDDVNLWILNDVIRRKKSWN